MRKKKRIPIDNFLRNIFSSLYLACIGSVLLGTSSIAELVAPGDIPPERDVHNNSVGVQEGRFLDVTNPMELINRLKRATAMDNATTPSDAIDDALEAFEYQKTDEYSTQP